ncbi:SgcJ/EcaC family oxidoreductase [Streptomyces sp. NPDC058664]|uniref:SgcJ/EcaC family oxidoreductase n=1 Tax=unclassified Streptomyces TaxID=2593676 RepID=UPI003649E8A8
MKPLAAGVTVPDVDVDAIVTLVAEVEHAQRNALPDALVELFRHDALWSVPYGTPLIGIDEIGVFTRRFLPGTAEQPLTSAYTIEHIQFVRPDVAVVEIRQRPVTRDGELLDDLLRRNDHGGPRSGCRRPSEAVRRWASLVAGHPGFPPDTALYVLTKTDGRWRIAVAQNTPAIEADTLAA